MAHSRFVKINTPIPSIEEYGKGLGLSRSRQRDIIRLMNPDLTGAVVQSKHGLVIPKSLKTSRGKVLSTTAGKIVVEVTPSRSKKTGAKGAAQKVIAADRFKLARVGDTVRIVATQAQSHVNKHHEWKPSSFQKQQWALDEVVERSGSPGKSGKQSFR